MADGVAEKILTLYCLRGVSLSLGKMRCADRIQYTMYLLKDCIEPKDFHVL